MAMEIQSQNYNKHALSPDVTDSSPRAKKARKSLSNLSETPDSETGSEDEQNTRQKDESIESETDESDIPVSNDIQFPIKPRY